MPCRPAISSHSLGRAWVHDLPTKLDQAARYGFDIELFFEDLYYVAKSLDGGTTAENQLKAAALVRAWCLERSIAIVCLQPFMHYEGLKDRQRHAERIEEMKLWLQLAKTLGTRMISIPSSFLPQEEISSDVGLIVQDLREVADMAAKEGIQVAFESLAWGTYIDTWEQAWNVVKKVDRSNFGLCLDTFNIAARVYADPTAANGKRQSADSDMAASLRRLVQTVDVRKIFYVQVVDGEYLLDPLVEGHRYYDPDQPARMSWSRNCRVFYGETKRGAYLPIRSILKAVLVDLGFEGWVSAELFNRSLTDQNASVPESHARRARESWQNMVDDVAKMHRSKLQLRSSRRSNVVPHPQL